MFKEQFEETGVKAVWLCSEQRILTSGIHVKRISLQILLDWEKGM